MKQYIKDHVYFFTTIISIIGCSIIVLYLVFERGYELKTFVDNCSDSVLGIATGGLILTFTFLTFLIKETNQWPKLQYTLKVMMIFVPIIATPLFFVVYHEIEQPPIACKQQAEMQTQRLHVELKDNIKSYLPVLISQAAANNLPATGPVLNQIDKKQQAIADSFLQVTEQTIDASCRNYYHEKVDSLLKDNTSRISQNVAELRSFTKDLQILVDSQNENGVNDFLNKHHVSQDAVLYEYWQNLNDPPREHLNFRDFLLGLVTNGIAKRIISAVVQLDEKNNLIAEVYIITR
jgi:hypothetical protein